MNALIKQNKPFNNNIMSNLFDPFESIFDTASLFNTDNMIWMPSSDVTYNKDNSGGVIEIPMPGVDDILATTRIEISDGVLHISYKRNDSKYVKSFDKNYKLKGVDPDSLNATYKDGVLRITFNSLKSTAKKTEIPINIEN